MRALFCCRWRNVEPFCHKQDSLMRGAAAFVDRRTRTTHKCYYLYSSNTRLSSSDRRSSQMLVENRDLCLHQLHSTPPLSGYPSEHCHSVWCVKTRMVWLPDGEDMVKICLFVSTEYTNVTDGRTDTARRHKRRLCIASRGKNVPKQDILNTFLSVCLFFCHFQIDIHSFIV